MFPSSSPCKRLSIWFETKASFGSPWIKPLCSSLKSASRASNASGSLPISLIWSCVKPALANWSLALVILAKDVPTFFTATEILA